jgi:two-component system alkaline phosphatase synthesis response regulator PhoP
MADRILVVDDNDDVTRITAKLLTIRGYEVTTASDGPQALELARTEHPDCLLLDVMMPAMSGLDVLAELKRDEATARIPVILITARVRDEDVLAGYKEGADYYITKPFSGDQLLYGIRLVLGRKAVPQEQIPPPGE